MPPNKYKRCFHVSVQSILGDFGCNNFAWHRALTLGGGGGHGFIQIYIYALPIYINVQLQIALHRPRSWLCSPPKFQLDTRNGPL